MLSKFPPELDALMTEATPESHSGTASRGVGGNCREAQLNLDRQLLTPAGQGHSSTFGG